MIGADELRALGRDGVLVNVGRGPLVQEQALFDALSSSTIAGAAIDVWYDYPGPDGRGTPSALPFSELPNILMTPHSSGVSQQTFVGRVDDIADNITRLARGEQLRNVVTPRRRLERITGMTDKIISADVLVCSPHPQLRHPQDHHGRRRRRLR